MASDVTLLQLRYFVAVVEEGTMTAASRRLSLTQSSVSAAIAGLEAHFGVPLLIRSARKGLAATEAGKRLYRSARMMLDGADSLTSSVLDDAEQLSGELTVGVFAPLAAFRAPVLLQAFEAAHPGVQVTFYEADQAGLGRALADGRCDVALLYDLGYSPVEGDVVVETIAPHVIVPASHPAAANEFAEVELASLAEEPFVLYDVPHSSDYFLSLFRQLGLTPRIRHRASGYETVRSFVARGHGYSVLNQRPHHTTTAAGGSLAMLRIVEDLPAVRVLLAFPQRARPSRKALAFAQVCQRLYGVAGAE